MAAYQATSGRATSGVHPPYSAAFAGQRTLRDFAAAFFTFTLLADAAYVQTVVVMWQDFASWTLLAGLVSGGISVLLWLAGIAVHRHRPHWPVVIVNVSVLVAAFLNSLVHAGDGWTAIVPWGIGLSAATFLLMLVSAALTWLAARRSHS